LMLQGVDFIDFIREAGCSQDVFCSDLALSHSVSRCWLLRSCWKNVVRQQSFGLLMHTLGAVVGAGERDHEIEIGKNRNLVSAVAAHEISAIGLLSRFEIF